MPVLDQLAGDAARIPMTEDAILALLRQHFGDDDSLYLAPTIPPKREAGARRAHAAHLPKDERILALYDDTVLGTGEDGFLLTSRRLCFKNINGKPFAIEWAELDPESMVADGRKLTIGTASIQISGEAETIALAEAAFYVLAVSARPIPAPEPSDTAPTTPPPPHPVSYTAFAVHASSPVPPKYSCWMCSTSVAWDTPKCNCCGAAPTEDGWARTA